jgi:hypothetical protein
MPDNFKSLKDVFRLEPDLKKLREVVKSSDVINDFNSIFPDLEKIAKAHRVDKKALIIKVENAGWRSELKFKEIEMINKINKFYNEERIIQIRLIG